MLGKPPKKLLGVENNPTCPSRLIKISWGDRPCEICVKKGLLLQRQKLRFT